MSTPTVSGLYHHEQLQAYECGGCLEMIEIPRSVMGDPETLLSFREMLELDHKDCASYGDVKSAQLARKYRKEAKRRGLTAGSQAQSAK